MINKLEFIKESAAIAVSPEEGGPSVLVIYAVCLPSNETAENKLRLTQSIVKKRLNPLFKVHELIEIDKLPRTASGKVMRRELRKSHKKQN